MHLRRPRPPLPWILAVAAAAILLALLPAVAGAATTVVHMKPGSFGPAAVTVARGGTVRWSNQGPTAFLAHDVQSTAPAGYFSSGGPESVPVGSTWSFTFRSAGRFGYLCSVHAGMTGTVTVPIAVGRLAGPVRFRVTLASRAPATPWKHEVQVRRPGSTRWVTIATTGAASVTWRPSAHGRYSFRARLVKGAPAGARSGWTPAVAATW